MASLGRLRAGYARSELCLVSSLLLPTRPISQCFFLSLFAGASPDGEREVSPQALDEKLPRRRKNTGKQTKPFRVNELVIGFI